MELCNRLRTLAVVSTRKHLSATSINHYLWTVTVVVYAPGVAPDDTVVVTVNVALAGPVLGMVSRAVLREAVTPWPAGSTDAASVTSTGLPLLLCSVMLWTSEPPGKAPAAHVSGAVLVTDSVTVTVPVKVITR